MLEKLEALWREVDLDSLKRICRRDIRFSDELIKRLNSANNLGETFDLLSKTPFCTWLEIRILKRMAKTAKIPEATQLIQIFEDCVHSRKCSEVKFHLNKKYIHPDHLTSVHLKFNKNSKKWIVSQLIEYCHELETISNLPADSSTPTNYQDGCLEVYIVIPNYCSLHAYKVAQKNFFKLRYTHIQYLQIGKFPKIYTVKFNVNESENAQHILKRMTLITNCKLSISH